MENRRKPAPPAAALDINCDCKEYVIDYLAKSFPVRLMAVFTDENGNPRSEPMSDEQGAPVLCRSALAARDRMIEQLCALPPIATALDAIIERFGVDKVAEVTGRTRRLIIGRDGRQKLQSRSPRANVAETQAFMDGAKRILVFSDAGGTGRSYHADLAAKNQARRVHFLLEPGWRADAAIQGLGRTNRTNQASAPLFRPVTTDVRGERRFISTIARRLDSLGALTRGQRQTGGQNLFDPADNLESIYAKEALHRWFGLLFTGKLEAVSLGRFQELTGLRIEAPDGSMADDLPSIQRWLNRIWVLREAGVQVSSAAIRHLNNQFFLTEEGSYHGAFVDTPSLEDAKPLALKRPKLIAEIRSVLGSEEPARDPGDHCHDPFPCEFVAYCSRDLETARYPVSSLPRTGRQLAAKWAEHGIVELEDVPPGSFTNAVHARIHEATLSGIPYHDVEGARRIIGDWAYPRTYLDFETIAFALPRWLGTKPWEQVPFQFSAHIEDCAGQITHREFLSLDGKDPRRICAEALLAQVPQEGTVIAYNAAFERTCILRLAERFSDLAEDLKAIAARIVDLLPVRALLPP